jgi:hypothetical protein
VAANSRQFIRRAGRARLTLLYWPSSGQLTIQGMPN